jgi:hypothetical protein
MRQTTILTLLLLLIFSCQKKKTIWNSGWSAPIINDTLSLANFVNDSTLISTSSGFDLNLHRTVFDFELTDILEIPDLSFDKKIPSPFVAFNIPPGLSFQDTADVSMVMQDSELKIVTVSEGFVDVQFLNPINATLFYTVKIPEITKDGLPFIKTYSTPPGSNVDPGLAAAAIDIAGYTMNLSGEDGSLFNFLQAIIIVQTDPDGSTTLITDQDTMSVSATFRDIKASYAKGYFGNKILSNTAEVVFDFLSPVLGGSLDLPSANLKVSISNGVKVPFSGKISYLSNENAVGNVVSLSVNSMSDFQFGQGFDILAASGSNGTVSSSDTEIAFNAGNSSLEPYLENLGNSHSLAYSIELNPLGNVPGTINEISLDSRVTVSIDLDMPLQIGLDGLTVRDTFAFTAPVQNHSKARIKAGKLVLLCENAFPISGQVTIDLLAANGSLLHSVSGSNAVSSSLDGYSYSYSGVQVSNSSLTFLLTEDIILELGLVKNIALTTVFDTYSETGGSIEKMPIPASAYLGVKMKGDFELENQF